MKLSKKELISTISDAFEMADDKLLEDNNWCKYIDKVQEKRNNRFDAEEFVIGLINKYYKEDNE